MRLRCYISVALGALALGSCGGGGGLDTDEVEREVGPEVERQTGTDDVKIDCPDDVDQKKGETFDCDLSAAGGVKAKVRVEQVDDDGNVNWEVVRP